MYPQVRASLPQVIDSTIRAEYVSCHTKGYYSFQRNLASREPSTDLICGGAFARGLEITRLGYYYEKLPLEAAIEKGMLAAILHYGDHVPSEFKVQKGVDRVCTALSAYFDRYHPDRDIFQPYYVDNKPAVEFTFSVPLPINHPETGQPFLYGGRFDLLALYNGQLIGVDEKTASQLGPTWKNKWNLRGQFTGYVWACQQYGLPVIGIVARGVSFLKETKQNPIGHGFEESLQMRDKFMLDTWYEQLLSDIRRMVWAWENNWYDQDFNEECAAYSGCPFQRLCTSPSPEDWTNTYGIRIWNPLEKNPEARPEGEEKKLPEIVEAPEELLALMNR